MPMRRGLLYACGTRAHCGWPAKPLEATRPSRCLLSRSWYNWLKEATLLARSPSGAAPGRDRDSDFLPDCILLKAHLKPTPPGDSSLCKETCSLYEVSSRATRDLGKMELLHAFRFTISINTGCNQLTVFCAGFTVLRRRSLHLRKSSSQYQLLPSSSRRMLLDFPMTTS